MEDGKMKTPWGSLVVFIIGMSFVGTLYYIVFVRPESIGDVIEASKARTQYEREIREKEERISELEATLESERDQHGLELATRTANLNNYESWYQQEKERADSLQKQYEDEVERRKVSEGAARELAEYRKKQATMFRYSVGGFVDNPFDTFNPNISAYVGAGQGKWRVLTGFGIGWDAEPRLSLGFEWNFR